MHVRQDLTQVCGLLQRRARRLRRDCRSAPAAAAEAAAPEAAPAVAAAPWTARRPTQVEPLAAPPVNHCQGVNEQDALRLLRPTSLCGKSIKR